MKTITNNFQETQRIGELFAQKVIGGDVILLFGDLGSGKTTFMQGFAKGLGIKRRINSPTFLILCSYVVHNKPLISMLYHIDLYRTQSTHDLEGLGLSEILSDKSAVTAIEWPEKLGSLLPHSRWEISFETIDENKRSITIKKYE